MHAEEPTRVGEVPAIGRIAAVDYGRRRMGLAVCDRERILASPLLVRQPGKNLDVEATFFRKLVGEEELVGFVVGLPLHADGRESDMSRETRRFAEWLATTTGLPVALQDERYTSAAAAGRLAGVGLSRGSKKARSDAVAAQIMLETWLSRRSLSEHTPSPAEPIAAAPPHEPRS
jgi:putative Holliday junction resolvase